MKISKYLITGFAGFVSRHFLWLLEKQGKYANVKGVDLYNPKFELDNFTKVNISFEKLDLLKKTDVDQIIDEFKPDYILHLASYSSVAFSWKEPIISFNNNTNIFLNLLEAVRKYYTPARILSIGSSEEYGNVDEKDLPLKEEHTLRPVSPYGVARVSQELLSKIYVNGFGLDIVMTRSFNHIGPYQKNLFVISSLVKQLVEISKNEDSRELFAGDISIVRDFIDVRDVVSAYYLLLCSGKKGAVYNVCSGKGFSLKDMIRKICGILSIDVSIKVDPKLIRPDDNKIIIGSNAKITNSLGWEMKYTL